VREWHAPGAAAESARQRFAQCQANVTDSIETLKSTGSLTPLGMSFVSEMRRSALR
jgi:HEXXH motif-containing protein